MSQVGLLRQSLPSAPMKVDRRGLEDDIWKTPLVHFYIWNPHRMKGSAHFAVVSTGLTDLDLNSPKNHRSTEGSLDTSGFGSSRRVLFARVRFTTSNGA